MRFMNTVIPKLVSTSDQWVADEVSYKQGRGRDPLRILIEIEATAHRRYQRICEHSIPLTREITYIRLWVDRVVQDL